MGKRAGHETILELLAAFAIQRTWTQPELARKTGVSVDTIREVLSDVQRRNLVKLEREEEHPNVYWSVPKDWHPAGVLLSFADARELCRELARTPETPERDRLLETVILKAAGGQDYRGVVDAHGFEAEEAHWLTCMEDGARLTRCVRMTYYSGTRGTLEKGRLVSPQRVFPSEKRFLAWCHKGLTLKYFRFENVMLAETVDQPEFHAVADEELRRKIEQSADGFHGGEPPITCVFIIRETEARWAVRALPAPRAQVAATPVEGGVRVELATSGQRVLARFLAGLGDAVTVETPALREMVVEIARGALRAHGQG